MGDMGDKFIIKGLGGKRALSGNIDIKGAKNAALKAFAASVLFRSGLILKRVPQIEDIKQISDILLHLRAKVKERQKAHHIAVSLNTKTDLPDYLAKKIRASIVLTGPILARFGHVSFPHPGGCVIGERPIDLFLDGYQKMGAVLRQTSGTYILTVPLGKLKGATIFFRKPSVTATETLMMAAILANGKTVIKNAAREPEIEHLAAFLNTCGARIKGVGTETIEILGTPLLENRDRAYTILPDRIETGSFLILGALLGEELEIRNCNPVHVETLIETLRAVGVSIEVHKDKLIVRGNPYPKKFTSMDIETREYPGFPTDLQAPTVVFLTQTSGSSLVFETIFGGRLSYIDDLVRMGARIDVCDPHRIIVHGPAKLYGRELESPDLRAGLAFVIAAIVANGTSVIHNVYNIDRGYERIEERLQKIGVNIKRVGS